MRAAVLTEDHTFEVVEAPDPQPGADELLLRVVGCGICGSDLKAYKMFPAGTVLGHEFAGEIVDSGKDAAARWQPGQLVAALPLNACGHCRWCLADEPAHCETVALLGVGGGPGAFAEYVRVKADAAVALRPDLGDYGALVEPLAVGLHTVRAADLRPGDRVLVIGGGNVGAAVAVWARRLGAAEVVVSDPSSSRRAAAGRFGATDVIDPTAGAPSAGFDVVFECVGIPGLVQQAVDAAAVKGRVVICGVCFAPDPFVPGTAVLKEVQIRFAVYYGADEFRMAARLLESGEFDKDAFVTSRVGLDQVGSAFTTLLAGDSSDRKVLITPGA